MRSLGRFFVAGVLALSAVLAVPSPSQSAVGPTPATTPSFNKMVRTIVHSGSTIYVGGNFTEVTDTTGTHTRRGAAAIDATTGLVLPWNPNVVGQVHAIAVGAEGVYLGGAFTSVRGHAVTNLAKVTVGGSGAFRKSFGHAANRTVHALALDRTRLYAGGDFTRIDSARRLRVAAFSRATSRLQAWSPRAAKGSVLTLKATKAGVYVGGAFWKINGKRAAGRLALVSKKTGRVVRAFNPPVSYQVFGIAVNRKRVFAAIGGPGGGYVAAFGTKNGRERWRRTFDGDVQALSLLGRKLYVGGHFNKLCNSNVTGPSGVCVAGGVTRARLAVFTVSGGLGVWAPAVDSVFGVSAVDAIPGSRWLAIGGTFNTVAGQARGKFAMFGPGY